MRSCSSESRIICEHILPLAKIMDTYRDRDIIRKQRLKATAILMMTIIPYQNLVAYELEVTCNSVS
jgi:hypothetical protein